MGRKLSEALLQSISINKSSVGGWAISTPDTATIHPPQRLYSDRGWLDIKCIDMWSITQEYLSLIGCPATLTNLKALEIQQSPSFSVLTGFVPKQMLNLMAWDPAFIKCCSRAVIAQLYLSAHLSTPETEESKSLSRSSLLCLTANCPGLSTDLILREKQWHLQTQIQALVWGVLGGWGGGITVDVGTVKHDVILC